MRCVACFSQRSVLICAFNHLGPLDGSDSGKSGLNIFEPKAVTTWWPEINFTDYKAALHGRYGRAVHLAAFHRGAGRGFTMSAIAAGHGRGTVHPNAAVVEWNTTFVLVRLAEGNGSAYRYYKAGNGEGEWGVAPVEMLGDGALFYGALLQSEAGSPFSPEAPTTTTAGGGAGGLRQRAMQVELAYGPEGRRLVDMAHAAVGDTLDNYVGDFPNYGDGSAYWSINRNDNGSLPLITFTLVR